MLITAPAEPFDIPPTLRSAVAGRFWIVVVLIGVGAGVGAVALTKLLEVVQHWAWPGQDLLEAAKHADPWRHIWILLAAGALTGIGQIVLRRLTSGNGIDITEAISEHAGRLPVLRTAGSAVLSVVLVGMGASLGREGAPKQVGAVLANVLSDRARLSDEQRRLLVACGAGAGMAAVYGVPLGGALFALEVLRGVLALRLILPALLASAIAAGIAWLVLPNAPTYDIPAYPSSSSVICWALIAGPIAGLVSIAYVHLIAFADRNKPERW
jgi:chloride channel protein, CIC family